tara:strand:+ start:2488 stop:2667 length:180 start_codon:yes stop_codon:yes gene_type:complete
MSEDTVFCNNCDCAFVNDTSLLPHPGEACPECGNAWTGEEKRSTMIEVTMPTALSDGAG